VKGKRIDHIGIVVDDLESARRFVCDVLGFAFDREVSIPGRLEAAFYRCGDAGVELIEITDSQLRRKRLGRAVARLEHVAVEVDDLSEAVATLHRSGVEMSSEMPTVTGPTRSYFTRPQTTDGIIYQVFDRPSPDPDGV
jgi:methylmalonyl-CoA/ethylmalonyl-CoA epimerase